MTGRPISPNPRRLRLEVRLTPSELDALRKTARELGESVSTLVRLRLAGDLKCQAADATLADACAAEVAIIGDADAA